MTYEENLQQTTEDIVKITIEMMREDGATSEGWDDLEDKKATIEHFKPIATYCLKKQAETYRAGYQNGCGDTEIGYKLSDADQVKNLQLLGLIEKEGGE